jgi:hypothetical protein
VRSYFPGNGAQLATVKADIAQCAIVEILNPDELQPIPNVSRECVDQCGNEHGWLRNKVDSENQVRGWCALVASSG